MFNKKDFSIYSVNGSHYALQKIHLGEDPTSMASEDLLSKLKDFGNRISHYQSGNLVAFSNNSHIHSDPLTRLDDLGDQKYQRIRHLEDRTCRLHLTE